MIRGKGFDLVAEIASHRAAGWNGLDATTPLTKDYLERMFAKYDHGRLNQVFDDAMLSKALAYLHRAMTSSACPTATARAGRPLSHA